MNSATETPSNTSANTASSTSQATHVASEKLQEASTHYVTEPAKDLWGLLRDYAHEKPDVAAMWCFGLGMIVGWKLHR